MEGNPAQGAQNHFYHKIYCFWVSKYLPHSHTHTQADRQSVRAALCVRLQQRGSKVFYKPSIAVNLLTTCRSGVSTDTATARGDKLTMLKQKQQQKPSGMTRGRQKGSSRNLFASLGANVWRSCRADTLVHTHTQSRTSCGYPFFICGCLFEKCAQFTIEIAACAFG